MDRDTAIYNAIYWRNYQELDQAIASEIEEWGWPCLRKLLLAKMRNIPSSRLRDGLLHVLGLDTVRGIDIDPADWIREYDFSGESMKDIRMTAHDAAFSTLKDMIERRNTFFLDINRMAAGPFAILIPSVLEARKKELEEVESPAKIWDLVQTAYGYYVFSSGGVLTSNRSSDHSRLREIMSDVAGDIGLNIEVTSSPLHLGYSISGFDNCSEHTRHLLWHLLRLKTYKGKQNVRESAKYLERHAHSEVAPHLHEFLTRTKYYYTAVKIFRVLGKIGLEESLESLIPFVKKGKNWGASALKAISTLAGERVTKWLTNEGANSPGYQRFRILRYVRERPSLEILDNIEDLKQGLDGWHLRRVERIERNARKKAAKVYQ